MENHETRQGILALIDIVNYTGQSTKLAEKYTAAGELLVTHELYRGIKPLLTSRNIEARRMTLEQSLKGFDGEEWFPPFYKLKIARKELGAANLLEQRIDELEREVQFIRVFGNMYSPVPMDKNFINLSIHCDGDIEPDFDCEEFLEDDNEPGKAAIPVRGKRKKIREEDDWIFIEKMERKHRPDLKDIDVNTLYENKGNKYTNGVIFGLPGAG